MLLCFSSQSWGPLSTGTCINESISFLHLHTTAVAPLHGISLLALKLFIQYQLGNLKQLLRVLKLETAKFSRLGLKFLHWNMKGFTITLLVVATFSLSTCLPARNPADKLLKRGKKPFLIYSVFLSFVRHIFFFKFNWAERQEQ